MSNQDEPDKPLISLHGELPSIKEILDGDRRGASIDQQGEMANRALDLADPPGNMALAKSEAYRKKLIAGIGSMRSQGVNRVASGGVTGLVVAAGLVAFVTVGIEAAVVVGGVALVARFLGGRR
jgi:hypothetical protein